MFQKSIEIARLINPGVAIKKIHGSSHAQYVSVLVDSTASPFLKSTIIRSQQFVAETSHSSGGAPDLAGRRRFRLHLVP